MEHNFEINPELTTISLAYGNKKYIADKILPRVKVNTESFKYTHFNKDQFYTIPETIVGSKGMPNKVELKGTLKDASVETHSLMHDVPQADVTAAQKAGSKIDPLQKGTLHLTNLMMLAREKRTANTLFDANAYSNANKITLSGSDKISDPTSDAIDIIQSAIDELPISPTHMVLNRIVFSKLCRHPKIVKAYNGNSGDAGKAPLDFIANMFGLEDIFVGEAVINSSAKGQKASLSGVWGNNMLLYFSDPTAEVDFGLTFGITAEYEDRQIYKFFDNAPGAKGVNTIKAVEQVKELIIAPDCGYLIQNAI